MRTQNVWNRLLYLTCRLELNIIYNNMNKVTLLTLYQQQLSSYSYIIWSKTTQPRSAQWIIQPCTPRDTVPDGPPVISEHNHESGFIMIWYDIRGDTDTNRFLLRNFRAVWFNCDIVYSIHVQRLVNVGCCIFLPVFGCCAPKTLTEKI